MEEKMRYLGNVKEAVVNLSLHYGPVSEGQVLIEMVIASLSSSLTLSQHSGLVGQLWPGWAIW